jgi:hypothetical protein
LQVSQEPRPPAEEWAMYHQPEPRQELVLLREQAAPQQEVQGQLQQEQVLQAALLEQHLLFLFLYQQ